MAMTPVGGKDVEDLVPLAEINITPFVDVVLVLLIIFMVAAPLLSSAVPIDLPGTADSAPQPPDPLVVSVDRQGEVWVKDDKVAPSDLAARLAQLHGQAPEQAVFLRGDKALSYGRLMEVMESLQGAGFTAIALAAEPRQN